jgi:hypothetical protein
MKDVVNRTSSGPSQSVRSAKFGLAKKRNKCCVGYLVILRPLDKHDFLRLQIWCRQGTLLKIEENLNNDCKSASPPIVNLLNHVIANHDRNSLEGTVFSFEGCTYCYVKLSHNNVSTPFIKLWMAIRVMRFIIHATSVIDRAADLNWVLSNGSFAPTLIA